MIASEAPLSQDHDAATRDDAEFAAHFEHRFTTIDGVQMHYVIGGTGPQPIVLLHGFPETWYSWRPLMTELLPGHTVIAIDLPGLGDSTGDIPRHDKAFLARYVHLLLVRLGYPSGVQLVAHDFGGGIAFALVTGWRDQFSGLLLMDFPVAGGSLSYAEIKPLSFHFAFHSQEPLFEQLVAGRERTYLEYFYRANSPATSEPVPAHAVDEFVRAYSRRGVLHHGSRYYQAWPEDEVDNRERMGVPLTIPVHLLAQAPLFDTFLEALRGAAPAAGGTPMRCGHWMQHEAGEQVVAEIKRFYGYPG
ncbi:alpha/beta fold hydrolase [Amycolatopsis jiangsuensis]|uniref:Pimeloyl-ACP methyl ester carboxylesterase n=1 Tax=Amycolatopsis jiangsuensis TaxID=1181879 RepID=A0A840IUZ8_9PSEU|nr:alpha/beta hydrolase [Amycolatopsis jiangsuensis]MBB4686336.1 pimeloyl-ACP methyl ester carboxylesterase [Amycolatopsis jiangsuensis]